MIIFILQLFIYMKKVRNAECLCMERPSSSDAAFSYDAAIDDLNEHCAKIGIEPPVFWGIEH